RPAAELWPAVAGELEVELRREGTLIVARDRDEAEALERELGERLALGLSVERLLGSEARRLEPALAPSVRLALLAHGDHAVDPRAVLIALARAARAAGAELRQTEVAAIVEEHGAIVGVEL